MQPEPQGGPVSSSYDYDPELAAALPGLPSLALDDLAAARTAPVAARSAADRGRLATITTIDRNIVRDGGGHVRLRIYSPPSPSGLLPGILLIHGGGFVLGSVEHSDIRAADLCRSTGALVASVDYRLAPEYRYPAALDDCLAALDWLVIHSDEIGLRRDRIAVHGTSAGANLAASVTLLCRDRGGPAVCFQFLSTPMLDDRQNTGSMGTFVDSAGWDSRKTAFGWDSYLGPGVAGRDDVPYLAAPARCADLSDLPPAYVTVMEFDPLRDEGIAYAQALLSAGVHVELHVFPGTFHGSVRISSAQISRRESDEGIATLQRVLHDRRTFAGYSTGPHRNEGTR